MQNFGGKKEFFSFNLVAQYRYCPPVFFVDCVWRTIPFFKIAYSGRISEQQFKNSS